MSAGLEGFLFIVCIFECMRDREVVVLGGGGGGRGVVNERKTIGVAGNFLVTLILGKKIISKPEYGYRKRKRSVSQNIDSRFPQGQTLL